ncbi:hypothetical protein Pan14r_35430 [Crateriforma conspicua]|uniref:Uncharacterized protein n=1 Tax=Crateriforma conspicua TaxID=2527996 RepID=A0A5C5Y8T7_9PLAN|nr:hypothetical protein Mal65_50060 [Crateriforma conspicua]TWT71233.1 hypothetical protein Pan14r_35430 [Crateriforma conspicua]
MAGGKIQATGAGDRGAGRDDADVVSGCTGVAYLDDLDLPAFFFPAFFLADALAGCDLAALALVAFGLAALAFLVVLVFFLLDLDEVPVWPPKIASQPSLYFSLVPTRKIVMTSLGY